MDEGAWYLGTVERTTLRSTAGGRKRAVAARMWGKLETMRTQDPKLAARATWMWWEGTLLLEGFAGIEVFRGDPDSRVEEFLRRRHYNWARDLDDTNRRFLAEDDQDARGEDAKDVAAKYSTLLDDHKLREAHRHAFKAPVSFTRRHSAQGAVA